MPQEIRLWRISRDNRLIELDSQPLDLESRLEIWLEQDVAVLSPDLLVIGRQLTTDHGGFIDLLCLDRNGDTVIVELKRGKTPREVTAQALDYASWVRDLSHDEIIAIAEAYLSDRRGMDLPRAFAARFGSDLPEVLNDDHSILVVASSVDPSSERIIRYLSEAHGVRINAMTFHYFPDSQGTELAGIGAAFHNLLVPCPSLSRNRCSIGGECPSRPTPRTSPRPNRMSRDSPATSATRAFSGYLPGLRGGGRMTDSPVTRRTRRPRHDTRS